MEEIKTKAVVLTSKDYLDADKIVSIFSLEYGKIACKFNGVRKQKAKLKSLIQPFTFIDLECFKRGDFLTAKTGVVLDSYPKITTDYNKTICAYIVVEIIDKVLIKNKPEPEIFMNLIKYLDELETTNSYTATINFIKNFFSSLGENLNNNLNSNHIYLDLDLGNFAEERTINSIEIDKRCYNCLNQTSDNDNLNKMCLKMLHNIFKAKYDIEINSFSFL